MCAMTEHALPTSMLQSMGCHCDALIVVPESRGSEAVIPMQQLAVAGALQYPPSQSENNRVWSPQWQVAMHQPETWGYQQFDDRPGSFCRAA